MALGIAVGPSANFSGAGTNAAVTLAGCTAGNTVGMICITDDTSTGLFTAPICTGETCALVGEPVLMQWGGTIIYCQFAQCTLTGSGSKTFTTQGSTGGDGTGLIAWSFDAPAFFDNTMMHYWARSQQSLASPQINITTGGAHAAIFSFAFGGFDDTAAFPSTWTHLSVGDVFIVQDGAYLLDSGASAGPISIPWRLAGTPPFRFGVASASWLPSAGAAAPVIKAQTLSSNVYTPSGTTVETGFINPTANRFLVATLDVHLSALPGSSAIFTVTGNGLTWRRIAERSFGTGTGARVLAAFGALTGSSPAGSDGPVFTKSDPATYTGNATSNSIQYDGIDLTTPIPGWPSSISADAQQNSTSGATSLSALSIPGSLSTNDITCAIFGSANTANDFTISPTSWSLLNLCGPQNADTQHFNYHNIQQDVAPSWSWTTNSVSAAAIGFILKAAPASGAAAGAGAGVGTGAGVSAATAASVGAGTGVGSGAGRGDGPVTLPSPDVWFDAELISKQWFDPELNVVGSWFDHEFMDPPAAAGTGVGAASGTGTAAGISAAIAASVGASSGNGTAAGIGRSLFNAVGAASGNGTAAGVGVAAATSVGAGAGIGQGIGVGNANFAGVGAATGNGTAAGIGSATAASIGAASGNGTATGVATSPATGAASGNGTAAGVGVAASNAIGAASGNGTASGIGAAAAISIGAASGNGTAAGIGRATVASVGAASGTGTANGISDNSTAVGAASGTGTAAGVGNSLASGAGAASGTGTAAATGAALGTGTGAASGTGTAAAVGQSSAASVGAASGIGTASGVGQSTAASVGAASGTGSGTGISSAGTGSVGAGAGVGQAFSIGNALVAAIGAAAGVGTAAGTAPTGAIGAASGNGTASGVGAALFKTVGAASGTSSAAGIGVAARVGVGAASASGTAAAVNKVIAASIAGAAGIGSAAGVGHQIGTSTRREPTTGGGRFGPGDTRPTESFDTRPAQVFEKRPKQHEPEPA